MKNETIEKLKYYIENKDKLTQKQVNAYLVIAKVFDDAKALSLLHNFMAENATSGVVLYNYDYYIINTYLMLNNQPTILDVDEVAKYKKENISNITKEVKYNCLKNFKVSIHSFNGALKDTITEEGLKIERPDNNDILKIHEIIEKIYPNYASFVILNSDTKKISAAFSPSDSVLEYANASPEWIEQYLNKNVLDYIIKNKLYER